METEKDELVFAGSWQKNGLLVLIAAAIAGLLYAEAPSVRSLSGLASAVFFLFSLIFIIQGARRLPVLTLTPKGFQLWSGFGGKEYTWDECYAFRIYDFVGPTAIAFNRSDTGAESVIINQFSATTAEVCDALSTWQRRYASKAA
jgi:hypothetical protein